MQTNLEPITQNEVSQKEKSKCCILKYMYGIQKDSTDEPICRATVVVENRRGHEGEGEDGTNGESTMNAYTLPYVKQIVSGNLLYGSGNSNWCSVDNLEGWDEVGGSRGRRHMYSYG